jgi:hypothetical protein
MIFHPVYCGNGVREGEAFVGCCGHQEKIVETPRTLADTSILTSNIIILRVSKEE